MKLYSLVLLGLVFAGGAAHAAEREPIQVVFNPAGKVPAVTMRSAKQGNGCIAHHYAPAGGKLHAGHGAEAAYEKCMAASPQRETVKPLVSK